MSERESGPLVRDLERIVTLLQEGESQIASKREMTPELEKLIAQSTILRRRAEAYLRAHTDKQLGASPARKDAHKPSDRKEDGGEDRDEETK